MFKETGAMLPEVSAAGKKVEKKDSTVNIEKEKDPIKERLLNFLKDEKIIQEMNGYPIVDVAKMESPEFKRRLRRLYLGRKNNTTLLGSMKIIKEKLQDFKGVPAEDFSHSLRINGNVHLKEVFSPKENYLKSKLLSFLEKTGILEMTDNGKNIFDIEKFLHTDFSTKNRAFIKGVKLQRYPAKAEIFEKLSDLKVVSKSDFEASGGKAEEIPLFNVPESIDEAYDIEKMRNKKYYLNYWDFYNYNKKQGISWNYKIKAKNGEKIETRELALATKIFRDFQGKRDSKGQLFVFDKEKGRFERLNVDWMRKSLGNLGNLNIYDAPHIFLLKFCPNLVRKKLIDIGDYGINTMGSSGNLLRKEFKIHSKSPCVMIKSARYYIGRNFFYHNKEKIPTENLKITVLDKNTAGIIETHKGKERLRYILPLISDQEREMKEQQIKERFGKLPRKKVSALLVMGKEDTAKRIYEWKPTKDNPIRENETAEEYAERIRRIGDFEYIKV